MSSPASKSVIIRFGPFEANLSTQELKKLGTRLRVPNQSFQILAMLLERPGQLVTRDELRQKLWPSDTFVEYDQGLNAAVNRLRDALGDSAEKPLYIETLPRRGYRFLEKTEVVVENDNETAGAPAGPAPLQSEAIPVGREKQPAATVSLPVEPLAGVGPAGFNWRTFRIAGVVIFICILFLWATLVRLKRRPSQVNFSSARVIPFTSLPGQEVAPTFSPDGSQIAFAWSSSLGKGFDLYVKTIGSERMIKLTDHPAHWISPAWSPDGTQIAFSRWSEDQSGIFAIPALGGPERKVADARFWYEPFMEISWLPDSKSLAYWSTGEGGSHIFLLAFDTLRPRMIDPALPCWDMASPSVSPDGKKLAFVCTSSIAVYSIYELPLSGDSPHLLASMMGYFRGLTWSADGTRVIFSNDSGDGGSLWEVDLDGRLGKLPFGEEGSNPTAAARGDRLAYVRGWKTIDIWRLDLHSRHPEESATKLIYSTRIQRVPQYSPDGKKIVFESDRSGAHEIWLADADGNNLIQLTSFNGPQTGSPSWCSDDHRIAFDSRATGSSAIYIEDINERFPRQVKTDVQNLALPTWSEDCQSLFASDGHDNLYRVPSQGGPASRISDKGSWFSVVKNGRVFFNVNQNSDVAIWSTSLNGGQEEPLTGMPRFNAAENWTATARGIYYTSSTSTPPAINFYDFVTRTVQRLCTLPQSPSPGGGLSVSPDGHWLLYTRTDDAQSDIMLASHFQ
jgi:Tol biopolymer transport system component/DNA-binding winged helix-turn-helix (wHTH) protein